MQNEREMMKQTALNNTEGLEADTKAFNQAIVRIRVALRKATQHLNDLAPELEQLVE